MALRIICGPARSGKTARAVEAFGDALDSGRRPVLIAPGRPDVYHIQRRILRERGALSDAFITTFNWFVLNCGSGEPVGRRATRIERQLVLRAAVRKAHPLEYLNRSAGYDGFIDSLGDLISEVQAAGLAPDGFAEACRDLLPQGLNNDIFKLLLEYHDALVQQGLIDSETEYLRAISALEDDPAPLTGRAFIVHGFHDFTPPQLRLLKLVADNAAELLVTLPFVPDSPAYRTSAGYFETMSAWPGTTSEFLVSGDDDDIPGSDLYHLRRELFSASPSRKSPEGSLRILEGAGVRGQAELVAAEILALNRKEGTSLDDIVVVCRRLGADARALLSVFDEYGIPWDYSGLEPLRDNPVGRMAIALLDLVMIQGGMQPVSGSGGAGASLLGFLRDAMPGYHKVDELDRVVRLRGIDEIGALLEEWNAIGGRSLRELETLSTAADTGVGALAEAMEQILTDIIRRDFAGSDAIDGAASDAASTAREAELVSLVTLSGVMHEVATMSENGDLQGGAAAGLLREAIVPVMIDVPFGNRRNCVRVTDPHRIMSQQFDAVFICGLLEKQFPAIQRVDPFINEENRGRLAAEHGIELEIADRDKWIDEERFLFLQAVARARSDLYLCYPYCDTAGSANIASIFVEEARSLFEDPPSLERIKRVSDVTFTPDEAPTPTAALHSLCLAAGNMHTGRKGIPARTIKKVTSASGSCGIGDRITQCLSAVGPSDFRPGPFITDHFSSKDSFSATGLMRYCSCPFRFFVERVLRPAPMELDTFFLDRGTIAHAALSDFHARMSRGGIVLSSADRVQLDVAREQMEQALVEAVSRKGLGDGVEVQVMVATLRFYLLRFIDKQAEIASELIPSSFEYGFGGVKPDDVGSTGYSDNVPQLGGWARLRGKIDRIDVVTGTSKAAIIDYKTSFSKNWTKWLDDCELQMLLYIFVARQLGFVPVCAAYFDLKEAREYAFCNEEHEALLGDHLKKSSRASSEEFDALVEEAERLALVAAEGIRSGDFSKTSDRDTCKGCGNKGVCRD
ncbi:MAG: PD-(D/E)XK nuclease family protein [Thermoleophilia bacterium]